MLRYSLATLISTVRHYKHIFATNGYLSIMPTFLHLYSNIQSNPIKKAIEYCCRQFYILHRVPFLLQMLGSISQLLDFDEQADITDTNKIQPVALFRLLIALEYNHQGCRICPSAPTRIGGNFEKLLTLEFFLMGNYYFIRK
ncbi:unnamed protein product [Didymodactylos carnosus]|uniref:Protein UNC80 C-terminal domain-containing protein n=1 Tax=Didymodactylos carnosus TaxID=1234261 RepID=A0A815H3A9_9BILA|nr:unnamed protein product [Didymodactylos carnosus]CAF1439511.1 unnamed protein product [Didymodactylos carnosus]CAF4212983.1 unnamed protein product [Didymodactylos carnosus]CAF4236012.1 unnamed protein product [Didymodactylos carnosus]